MKHRQRFWPKIYNTSINADWLIVIWERPWQRRPAYKFMHKTVVTWSIFDKVWESHREDRVGWCFLVCMWERSLDLWQVVWVHIRPYIKVSQPIYMLWCFMIWYDIQYGLSCNGHATMIWQVVWGMVDGQDVRITGAPLQGSKPPIAPMAFRWLLWRLAILHLILNIWL